MVKQLEWAKDKAIKDAEEGYWDKDFAHSDESASVVYRTFYRAHKHDLTIAEFDKR